MLLDLLEDEDLKVRRGATFVLRVAISDDCVEAVPALRKSLEDELWAFAWLPRRHREELAQEPRKQSQLFRKPFTIQGRKLHWRRRKR